MKWWRRLWMNQGIGHQLRLCPRSKRDRDLIVLKWCWPSPGKDLIGTDEKLWRRKENERD